MCFGRCLICLRRGSSCLEFGTSSNSSTAVEVALPWCPALIELSGFCSHRSITHHSVQLLGTEMYVHVFSFTCGAVVRVSGL